jgi:rRNA maturation endonuclease Nob1
MYKNEFADLLVAVGKFLKSLSDEDYNKFLKGNFQLSEITQKKVRKKESIKQLTQTDIDIIIEKIKTANSREEVQNILSNEASLSLKENLTKVARSLKILVQKIDKKEDIENKIIEFTIGSRLRNDAIRGLNLGNKEDNSNKGSN